MTPRVPPILPFLAAAAAAAVALTFCAPAPAQTPPDQPTMDTMVAEHEGVRIVIHRADKGACPAPFHRAQFFPKEGPSIEGCWVALKHPQTGAVIIRIDWSDGDQDILPPAVFVKPQGGV